MALCTNCRASLRRALRSHTFSTTTKPSSPSPKDILANPSWSVRSLVSPSTSAAPPDETITPSQLHHLLRLSALPLPKSATEEASMISTLQSQLRFVRAVQRVDTAGVEPLRAIRDETEQGFREDAVTLDKLKGLLDEETRAGYYQRPRRVKKETESEAENWDALATASRRAGRFFVVQSKKDGQVDESG
ncbi:hypothetical protein ACRE_004650 [Hapsidospora chrysogenum ATCC 11550]|uniref:Glutamyl-tRNA amidotransferase complex subunit Gta3 domain-containing protein n=1 Tax=Hapsidospora chrysogenum (strain ATCC 11550 / CBS 779.69 / DSM 880 / IAM 14645 / JCM 23072 / IMI 49137) TaxID=857340 RepID=A0A086THI2_HAPC1|nr:hypothetical protein ACRE_004650 [Hapsidospora chrysogenum ATCC 11550]